VTNHEISNLNEIITSSRGLHLSADDVEEFESGEIGFLVLCFSLLMCCSIESCSVVPLPNTTVFIAAIGENEFAECWWHLLAVILFTMKFDFQLLINCSCQLAMS
jgi:hypothetical protein